MKTTKLDRITREKIEEAAHDMTVGAGYDGPAGPEHLADLERYYLRRAAWDADRNAFRHAWRECLQRMAQP